MDDTLLVHTFLLFSLNQHICFCFFYGKRDEYFGVAGRLTPMDGKLAPKFKTRENVFYPNCLNMLSQEYSNITPSLTFMEAKLLLKIFGRKH